MSGTKCEFQTAVEFLVDQERQAVVRAAKEVHMQYLERRKALFEVARVMTRYGLEVRNDGNNGCRMDWVRYHPIKKEALEKKTGGERYGMMRSTVRPSSNGGYSAKAFKEAMTEEEALIRETERQLAPIRHRLRALGKVGIAVRNYQLALGPTESASE